MKEDSAAGISLLASALALVATMMLHPTAQQVMQSGSAMAAISHSLALMSIPLALFGFLIVTRRLERMPNLSLLAFITYAFGAAAITSAAVFSGFIAPAFAADDLLLHYTGHLNRAFAGVDVVASSVAIILWSVAMFRERTWIGSLGIIIGAVALLAVGSGHLRLNLHGFGAVAISQAIWTICVAVMMLRNARMTPE